MRLLAFLPRNRDARGFFVAHSQSSLGTGAGYVALLIVAYERLRSPLAVSLILLADILPTAPLGPLAGVAAAFGLSYVAAGIFAATTGVRSLFALAAAGVLCASSAACAAAAAPSSTA